MISIAKRVAVQLGQTQKPASAKLAVIASIKKALKDLTLGTEVFFSQKTSFVFKQGGPKNQVIVWARIRPPTGTGSPLTQKEQQTVNEIKVRLRKMPEVSRVETVVEEEYFGSVEFVLLVNV